ncbi:DUF1918 domain-containing protein [Amycolatopsis sp. MtRt-6]|uniref:DUF1918 domain-containing protein n=1 Tax=Amycolatopsis sp. MtRt-6 TaxID=2792782 RepID=UPI001A9019D2|nr:DUF1918 domain-containing protein [Amycolatopsis sp. MtRt-6]
MHAKPGDWLVIKGPRTGAPDQRGRILEVHAADGTPPYVVRWTADDHVSTVFPGHDAVVLTAEEEQAAEEQARARYDRIQHLIHEEDSHVRLH